MTKTDGVTSASPGTSITYTIRVTNHGPSRATAASVTDTLDPASFDVASASWTCAITTGGPGPDSCAAPGPVSGNVNTTVDLSAGAVATITVTAPIRPGAAGTLSNTARAQAVNETDAVPGNDAATDGDTVLAPLADLALGMTPDTPAPQVGSPVVFTLTATNGGPADASGVVVTDLLPSGLTYLSDDGGGTYVPASGAWTIGALAHGASATLHLRARVDASSPITNVAEVTASSSPDPDSTPGNGVPAEDDRASVTLSPTLLADLSLTKTVDRPSPSVGSTVVFTLTVSNAGPTEAPSVQVTDLLPGGYAYVSDDGGGAYAPATGVWSVGTVAAGVPAVLHVTARVLAAGSYANVAEITASAASDPHTPGNSAASEDDCDKHADTGRGRGPVAHEAVDVSSPAVGSNVVFTSR